MKRSQSLPDFIGRGVSWEEDWALLWRLPMNAREEAEQAWMQQQADEGKRRTAEEEWALYKASLEYCELMEGPRKQRAESL